MIASHAGAPERWVPGWVPAVTLALIAGGLAVSIYLTVTHFTTHVRLACSATGVIDCQKVTTSPQSYIAGIPVAVLGVAFFVVAAALCLPAAWRSGIAAVRSARIGWAIAGVAMVVYLVYAELFEIDAICLWCSVVHAITIVLLGAVAAGEAVVQQHGAGAATPTRA